MNELKAKLAELNGVTVTESGTWLWASGDTKPHKDALKALGFRWSKKRTAWYWKGDASAKPAEEIDYSKVDASEYTGTVSNGYMGAMRWDGSNSRQKHLYGAGLSKAVRESLKKLRIRGVTVACHTYSGGQSLRLTITPSAGEVKTLDEYRADKLKYFAENSDPINAVRKLCKHDMYLDGQWRNVWDENWLPKLTEDEQKEILTKAIESRYKMLTDGSINLGYRDIDKDDDYTELFSPNFRAKLKLIKQVVDSFNYDDSNAMVDYFNRGFYEDYYLKVA